MKHNYLRSLVFLALGTMIMGCSKEEAAPTKAEQNKMAALDYIDDLPVVIPRSTVYPNEPEVLSGVTHMIRYGEEESDPMSAFTVIETPSKAYLDETCLFDFSKKTYGRGFSFIKNKNINLGFHTSLTPDVQVVKLPTNLEPVDGWNLPWGNMPVVQGNPKEVLFARILDEVTLVFSKPIIQFGVELTPNKRDYDCNVYVSAGKMQYDYTSGSVSKIARTPGGANFYGIKATQPFTTVTISWTKSTGTDPRDPEGFILANLRYKLAK